MKKLKVNKNRIETKRIPDVFHRGLPRRGGKFTLNISGFSFGFFIFKGGDMIGKIN